jgi:translation initiation factor 1A
MGKKKVLSEDEIGEMVYPKQGEILGIVTQLLGYDRLMVKCNDGVDRLCRIQGRMKRKVWIKIGDTVLVAPWDFQNNRGDIIWRYTKGQAQWLRSHAYMKT